MAYLLVYSSKSFAPLTLIFCILQFKYLWNPVKWSNQVQIFRECFIYESLLFLLKPTSFERWNYFCSKTTFSTQKCEITITTLSGNADIILKYFDHLLN